MPWDIIWTPTARSSYFEILQYLADNFSEAELKAFEELVREVLQLIGQFPEIYEYSEESDTHRCVLSPQVSLYYQVKESPQEIELLVFWDNRQDPDNLSLR